MNINNLTSLMPNMAGSISESTETSNGKSFFESLMNCREEKVDKHKVFVKEKDKDKITEDVVENINKAVNEIEDGSKEEIIEEIMALLQTLNIPIVDNTNLPIIIDLDFTNILEEIGVKLIEDVALEANTESLQFIEIDENKIENKIEDNIDKLLSYLSDKDGNVIKKEKFIELINTTTAQESKDEVAGIDMVKMVFNIDSSNGKENSEDDILAKLLSLEDYELNKTEVTDGEDYISESVDIFTDVLNGKNISSKPSINESNPKIILKKTLSTDVDLEENGELLQFIKIGDNKTEDNIDSHKGKENSEDDILAKLLSLEDYELSKTEVVDGEDYIAEDIAIFADMLNSKNSSIEASINESNPVTVSKETVSTDVVTNIKFMMKNEIQQLTVKVYPKELGEITIKLLSEDGIMKANIKSTSKETYMLLNSNMDEIKKYLSSENIAIKEVNIELYSDDTTYYSGQGFESQFQDENQQGSYFGEESKIINIKEEKEKEVLSEISNVNLLA